MHWLSTAVCSNLIGSARFNGSCNSSPWGHVMTLVPGMEIVMLTGMSEEAPLAVHWMWNRCQEKKENSIEKLKQIISLCFEQSLCLRLVSCAMAYKVSIKRHQFS